MAYVEQRGKTWRVKWSLGAGHPSGRTEESKGGFRTKKAALAFGSDQEAAVRAGRYIDRRAASTTLADYAAEWMGRQTVSLTTMRNRRYLLDALLLPTMGRTALTRITWPVVREWADRQTCARRTTQDAISLLSTILTGAVDDEIVLANALYRRKWTGGERVRESRVWCLPEDAVPIADRLDGVPRLMVLVAAFCGLRFGEIAALHRSNCLLIRRDRVGGKTIVRHVIRIDPEVGALHEVDGELILGPPKPPNGSREADVIPALADTLAKHLAAWPYEYVFTGTRGAFWSRRNWARTLRPACDGREAYPGAKGHAPREAWEALVPGLTLHGLRHGHKTAMIEDDIPEVLQTEQLGHEHRGVAGIYSHPTAVMRQRRLEALETRWRRAQEFGGGVVGVIARS